MVGAQSFEEMGGHLEETDPEVESPQQPKGDPAYELRGDPWPCRI